LGAFAVRLAAGYRLVFEQAHDPLPVNAGGTVDPLRVTAVRVVAIEDYHD
jgi:proteic killer suppression protein